MTNNSQNTQRNSNWFNKGMYLIDPIKYSKMPLNELRNKKNWRMFSTWFWALTASYLVISILFLLMFIFWFVDKDSIISNIQRTQEEVDATLVWRSSLVSFTISGLFPWVIMGLLIHSSIKCYKEKSFKKISILSTVFIFLQTIWGFLDMFKYLIMGANPAKLFEVHWTSIIVFIMPFIYILIWFFVSRNVAIIRRIFFASELREVAMKQIDEFSQGQESSFNPFTGQAVNSNFSSGSSQSASTSLNTNDAFVLRMKNLSKKQLHEMAAQLSISGYESMTDDEIIKIIYDIRNAQGKKTTVKEYEVQVDDKEDNKDSDNKN